MSRGDSTNERKALDNVVPVHSCHNRLTQSFDWRIQTVMVDRRKTPDRRKNTIRRNRAILGAYALIVFLTALGFYFFDREAKARDKEICLSQNEVRSGIQRFVRDVAGDRNRDQIEALVDKYFQLNEECPPETSDGTTR